MIKLLLTIFFFFSLVGYTQSGKITVRKNSTDLLGKTLTLNDLRGAKAGKINFTTKKKAIVQLEIELKNPVIKTNFGELVPKTEKLNCSYSIVNDSLLILTHNNYTDTCFYKYINENNNIVQLQNTLHGIITEEDFAICYHFDSILYSQTYNKSLSDAKFTFNIEIDSIYKNVSDEKLKQDLLENLKKDIENYTNNISFDYFKGEYSLNKNLISLLYNKTCFGNIYLKKEDFVYKIISYQKLSGSKPLTSFYTHNNYGSLIINYNKAIIQYLSPITNRYGIQPQRDIIKTDTFNINQLNASSILLFNQTDTLNLWQNNNFTNARINNALGGFYQTHFKALNGNKIPNKKLLFTAKEAIEVNNNYTITSNTRWEYKITDSALYLFNETDTLVDELKNSWESFSFTYRNNEPFVFGTYHYKTIDNKHEFLILFSNNTGVKFTRDEFEYKEARDLLKADNYEKLNDTYYKKFSFSASKEYLWLNFNDGKYQKLSFFNYNKALREQTKEQTNNYYLIE